MPTNFEKMTHEYNKGLESFASQRHIQYSMNQIPEDTQTVTQRTLCGKVYNRVVNFLNSNHLYRGSEFSLNLCPQSSAGREGFETNRIEDGSLSGYIPELHQLCVDCNVPEQAIGSTMEHLGYELARYCNQDVMSEQFIRNNNAAALESTRKYSTIYPASALSGVTFRPGKEAFGATMDTVIPDLKMALTVSLLKPNRGLMSRFMHRTTTAQSVITYIIHVDESYDLTASQDKKSEVRYGPNNYHNLITLYTNPNPVDMTLKPVVPIKSNDTDGSQVYEDGILKFGAHVNLFDLSSIPNKIGYDKYNLTDLLSERVIIDSVYVKVTKDSASEIFNVDLSTFPLAQLNMMQTTGDNAADKSTKGVFRVGFDKHDKTNTGAATAIFSAIDSSVEYVVFSFDIAATCNLMTSNTHAMGAVSLIAASSVKDVAVTDTLKTFISTLKVELLGYKMDVKYSEENLRKTSMAARSITKMITYELPQGKTCVVDHSMQQSTPEHVLNIAQEIQSIGIDHRNLQLFFKTLRSVHTRVVNERSDANIKLNFDGFSVNSAFVSGQKVNPEAVLATIDLRNVVTIRSSDMLSDVGSYFRAYLNKSIAMIHYRSLYLQNLASGESPVYKCITSNIIKEVLFQSPTIHPESTPDGNQMGKSTIPGETVEYTSTLNTGTRIEVITSAFNYMENLILIVPYRPNDPSSDLNFGHNHDGGQLIANYVLTDGENAVNRRMYVNTREFPVVTCPIGGIYTVLGLETVLPDIVNPYKENASLQFVKMS